MPHKLTNTHTQVALENVISLTSRDFEPKKSDLIDCGATFVDGFSLWKRFSDDKTLDHEEKSELGWREIDRDLRSFTLLGSRVLFPTTIISSFTRQKGSSVF
jgi:hypothetical protein